MASGVRITQHGVRLNVQALSRTLTARVAAALAPVAPQLAAWAVANHGWQNQTGAAERGLHAGVITDLAQQIVTLYLAHGADVFYGLFLETKFGGRDGVLIPAMTALEPDIRRALGTVSW